MQPFVLDSFEYLGIVQLDSFVKLFHRLECVKRRVCVST